jgi:hypothetical protein
LAGAEQNRKPEEREFFHEADPCRWRLKKTGANDNLAEFAGDSPGNMLQLVPGISPNLLRGVLRRG